MNLSKSIDFLLENAGPVIQYRLHKEILGDLTKTEEENLLEQIYQTSYFKLVQSYVKPSGYIGIGMHSGDRFHETRLQDGETAARLLSYYAIPKNHPIISNFITAMRDDEILRQEFSFCNSEISRFNSRFVGLRNGASGSGAGLTVLIYTMQSLLGYGDDKYAVPFQDISLKAFQSILPFSSLDKMTDFNLNLKNKRNCPFIREDDYMPCSYHLTALAYTNTWRKPPNIQMMADAVNHICTIMKDDNSLAVKINGRNYGSLWMLIHPIKPFHVNTMETVMYRRVLTEIAMLGVGIKADVIRQSVENTEGALSKDGIINLNFDSAYQKRIFLSQKWSGPYCDVWLEEDYKSLTALQCDLTFWAVQFLYFVKRAESNES